MMRMLAIERRMSWCFFFFLRQVISMQLPPVGSPMEEDEAALAQIPKVSEVANEKKKRRPCCCCCCS